LDDVLRPVLLDRSIRLCPIIEKAMFRIESRDRARADGTVLPDLANIEMSCSDHFSLFFNQVRKRNWLACMFTLAWWPGATATPCLIGAPGQSGFGLIQPGDRDASGSTALTLCLGNNTNLVPLFVFISISFFDVLSYFFRSKRKLLCVLGNVIICHYAGSHFRIKHVSPACIMSWIALCTKQMISACVYSSDFSPILFCYAILLTLRLTEVVRCIHADTAYRLPSLSPSGFVMCIMYTSSLQQFTSP